MNAAPKYWKHHLFHNCQNATKPHRHCFYSWNRDHSGHQGREEAVARLSSVKLNVYPRHARLTTQAERARQILQILQKLLCSTGTLIVALICNVSSIQIIGLFDVSPFTSSPTHVGMREPSLGAHVAKLEIAPFLFLWFVPSVTTACILISIYSITHVSQMLNTWLSRPKLFQSLL